MKQRTYHTVSQLCAVVVGEMFLSRFMGSQGGGRRTPDESGAKLSEAGLPLGFSLKQGYRPYMEDVYVAYKFQDPKDASNVSAVPSRPNFLAALCNLVHSFTSHFSPPVRVLLRCFRRALWPTSVRIRSRQPASGGSSRTRECRTRRGAASSVFENRRRFFENCLQGGAWRR